MDDALGSKQCIKNKGGAVPFERIHAASLKPSYVNGALLELHALRRWCCIAELPICVIRWLDI